MKQKSITPLLIGTMFLAIVGCGVKPAADNTGSSETTATQVEANAQGDESENEDDYPITEESTETEDIADDEGEGEVEVSSLPVYVYDGDAKIAAICDYLTKDIASQYSEAEVSIPYMQIIDTDDSNPEDILVWGDFWVMNYNLEGSVLVAGSGGNYPGLMHLQESSDGSYVVTEFEQVGDGSDFIPSAKKIFGDRYDEFSRVQSDNEAFEEIRKEYIQDYVKANGLNITAYQDYGWDPVTLE